MYQRFNICALLLDREHNGRLDFFSLTGYNLEFSDDHVLTNSRSLLVLARPARITPGGI